MLNDFIGGGQIFLHKVRMFLQVVERSLYVAFLISILIVSTFQYEEARELNCHDAFVYSKAKFQEDFSELGREFKQASRQRAEFSENLIRISKSGEVASYASARSILKNKNYIKAKDKVISFGLSCLLYLLITCSGILVLIFILWSRLGVGARKDKHLTGSAIKSAKEVAKYLKAQKMASIFKIAGMPLVKDSETKHMLITGTTGSGKTNLLNTLLPQILTQNHPALILDQTGEMISRYYNELRGDVIFNPLDARSHSWDFFKDIGADEALNLTNPVRADLEKFAKVLFSYGKSSQSNADPFWSNSAEAVFCACVESLIKCKDSSCNIMQLQDMITTLPVNSLKNLLQGTEGARYMDNDNKNTAASIISVMAAATKPLNYLTDSTKSFSLKKHFDDVKNGSNAVLFLSTPPNQREPLIPLISCIFELSVSNLINIGINEQRRFWFVIDELASLGKLGGLTTLLNEGRKYGASVVASTQSVSQVFDIYGYYQGNGIFNQFATKCFFRNDEPQISKIITEIFGQTEYQTKQKNTSYGAHEHRDGVSYTEVEKRKPLITADKLATLSDLECYVGLPSPSVRIARIKLPKVTNLPQIHEGYIPKSNQNQEDGKPKQYQEQKPKQKNIQQLALEQKLETKIMQSKQNTYSQKQKLSGPKEPEGLSQDEREAIYQKLVGANDIIGEGRKQSPEEELDEDLGEKDSAKNHLNKNRENDLTM